MRLRRIRPRGRAMPAAYTRPNPMDRDFARDTEPQFFAQATPTSHTPQGRAFNPWEQPQGV